MPGGALDWRARRQDLESYDITLNALRAVRTRRPFFDLYQPYDKEGNVCGHTQDSTAFVPVWLQYSKASQHPFVLALIQLACHVNNSLEGSERDQVLAHIEVLLRALAPLGDYYRGATNRDHLPGNLLAINAEAHAIVDVGPDPAWCPTLGNAVDAVKAAGKVRKGDVEWFPAAAAVYKEKLGYEFPLNADGMPTLFWGEDASSADVILAALTGLLQVCRKTQRPSHSQPPRGNH